MCGHVRLVRDCDLRATARSWEFAVDHAAAIDSHWHNRLIDNPTFFNGPIHLLSSHEVGEHAFVGRFLRTDFKSYLYWRETGYADASVHDAFGSALLRSADGAIVLGRQRPGNLNAGLTYPPGGFIDARDVARDGRIDISGSIARELAEELGPAAHAGQPRPGAIVVFAGPLVALAQELVSPLSAADLLQRARAHIAADRDSELEDVVAVWRRSDLEPLVMPDYARLLLEWVLASAP